MTLRRKAIIMICVVFAAALAITFAVSETILMKRFTVLEKQNTTQNTQRAVSALSNDFSSMSITFSKATADAKNFSMVMDENGEMHMKINITEPAFAVMGINYVIFVMSGMPPAGIGYNLETHESIQLVSVPGLMEVLGGNSPISIPPQIDTTAVTGILVLPEDTLLVQSYPYAVESAMLPGSSILGRLIFARFLDDAEVERLAAQTHLSLGLYRLDDPQMPDDFSAAKALLSDEVPVITQPLDKDTVAGYGLLMDIYGNPAMIIRADMNRDIYHQGQQTVYWLIVYLAAAFVMFALVVIILMNRVILSRLLGLSKGVDRVRDTGDLTERVAVKGEDELSRLGGAINGMLASLDKSQRELTEREAEKRALLNAIPDLMFRVGENGTILDARAAEGGNPAIQGISTDGKAYQELPQYKALSAEVVHRGLPLVRRALQTGETQVFEIQVPLDGDAAFYEARVAASSKNEALVMVRDITERKRVQKRLEYVSSHDVLSGLYNRAYFEEEFARLERGRSFFPVSIVMADVDGMKAVNDTYGHEAGDVLLQRAAAVLMAAFRSEDVVSRIGGDEFAVMLPGADRSTAEKALARVRQILAIHNNNTQGSPLILSIGVATGEEGCKLAEVMREADNRMYQEKQAKKAGIRNAGA
ncbi:MAG: diguanylate cyclase [Chloroflexi bacterium]|nr:diguanylate cyclase [Chloroflexota bacterium]